MDDNRLALVMLKPDAVRQQLTGPVLRWLTGRGFESVGFRQFLLSAECRANLYRTTRSGGRLDWQLNAVLYTLGPVQSLLLRGPAEDLPAASLVSGSLKGDFRPAWARPGTMRADLGALNPIFNLVHSADDPASVRRESRVLFDAGTVLDAAVLSAATTRPPKPFPLWSTVAGVLHRWAAEAGVAEATLAEVDWPADSGGPRHAALRVATRAVEEITAASSPGPARFLVGIRTGETTWDGWRDRTNIDDNPWPSYLTYTTLRYLDLCLETP
ncbi:nucleoside-diphosphate kinase [Salinispora pacifica]|uniref:nucleoside-diphosphate kinase n=1 Tax=Salinispora pacifica TaxID=351187 RepID=UPI0003A6FE1F|nr:nucleoside-diphosphate kinase [Salinispora pacifica]